MIDAKSILVTDEDREFFGDPVETRAVLSPEQTEIANEYMEMVGRILYDMIRDWMKQREHPEENEEQVDRGRRNA